MRNLFVYMAVLALSIVAGSTSANAQAQLILGGSASTLKFTGVAPGSVDLQLGSLCGEAPAKECHATYTSADGLTTTTGFYFINQNGSTISLSKLNASDWSVSQTVPLTFSFCKTDINCPASGVGVFLSGNLQLVDVRQSGTTTNGTVNYDSAVNLSGVTGSLAADFDSTSGILQADLKFVSSKNINTLAIGGKQFAKINHGTVDPTPEPSSMLLFGTGLLVVGGTLRRRVVSHS